MNEKIGLVQPQTTDLGAEEMAAVEKLQRAYHDMNDELGKGIVGQEVVIEELLIAPLCKGHALLVGVPGLAKTLLISTLSKTLGLSFNRIQFTPDLMPSDITGTEVIEEDKTTGGRAMRFVRGPIFANVILADEINRTPPKTQAALLEAMQEHQVTAGGKQHRLPQPFFVLATQNPIEQEGTYPLPEAQLDRFLLKVYVDYPDEADERTIYRVTTSDVSNTVEAVLGADELLKLQHVVRRVPVSDFCVDYVARLVRSTRHSESSAPQFVRDWILWGVGPRGGQSLIMCARARAALDGRPEVDVEDIKAMAAPVLRHRLVLNYNAESQGQTPETVIKKLIENIPLHASARESHGRIESVLKA